MSGIYIIHPPEGRSNTSSGSNMSNYLKTLIVLTGVILVVNVSGGIFHVSSSSSTSPSSSFALSSSINNDKPVEDAIFGKVSSLLRGGSSIVSGRDRVLDLKESSPVVTTKEEHHEQHFIPETGVQIDRSTISTVSKSSPSSPISMTSSSFVQVTTIQRKGQNGDIGFDNDREIDTTMDRLVDGFQSGATITFISSSSSSSSSGTGGTSAVFTENNNMGGDEEKDTKAEEKLDLSEGNDLLSEELKIANNGDNEGSIMTVVM
jgi:hypothetical protein